MRMERLLDLGFGRDDPAPCFRRARLFDAGRIRFHFPFLSVMLDARAIQEGLGWDEGVQGGMGLYAASGAEARG